MRDRSHEKFRILGESCRDNMGYRLSGRGGMGGGNIFQDFPG